VGKNLIITEDGVITCVASPDREVRTTVRIRLEDGSIEILEGVDILSEYVRYARTVQNGKFLRLTNRGSHVLMELMDSETLEVEKTGKFTPLSGDISFDIKAVHMNDDGTFWLAYVDTNQDLNNSTVQVALMDMNFTVVKTVTLEDMGINDIQWNILSDGGFVERIFEHDGWYNAENHIFRMKRYDRSLNVVWETTVKAHFGHFILSPEGEILVIRSNHDDETYYMDFYGDESAHRTEHVHSLVWMEKREADCFVGGHNGYWRCSECACSFSDQGVTVISDPKTILTPIQHSKDVRVIKGREATCTEGGLSDKIICPSCGQLLQDAVELPPKGHTPEPIEDVPATCLQNGFSGGTQCKDCYDILESPKMVEGDHSFGEWREIQPATIFREGLAVRYCELCGMEENKTIQWIEQEPPTEQEPSNEQEPPTEQKPSNEQGPSNEHAADRVPLILLAIVGAGVGILSFAVLIIVLIKHRR
jgi:hypothetical protein